MYDAVTNSNAFLLGNFIITMLNILCMVFTKMSILMDIHIIKLHFLNTFSAHANKLLKGLKGIVSQKLNNYV